HRLTGELRLDRDEGMNDLVPEDPSMPMDVRAVIDRLVDDGRLLEVQADFAKNLIVGFARIEGIVVGLLANQPTHLAGALDIDASDKGARFVRFCNAFNIPLVTLVDVPGFLPGVEQERGGIIRHGAKMLFAYASGTVPKFTVILRKAYGGSYLAMCSKEMGTDAVYAWPGAEIAVMGGAGAVNILYRRELENAEDVEATRAELIERYREEHATPYRSAARGYITDVIDPSETRATLALGLRKSLTKRELRPAKKHGNIPL
ncbi:carboxyl transferase domain-containing protein, partial [Mobilicoccus sp.]